MDAAVVEAVFERNGVGILLPREHQVVHFRRVKVLPMQLHLSFLVQVNLVRLQLLDEDLWGHALDWLLIPPMY